MNLRKSICTVLLFLFVFISPLTGAPSPSGAEGFLALPSAYVGHPGRLVAGIKYTTPTQFNLALNFVPLTGLELGLGKDFVPDDVPSLMASVKWRFWERPDICVGFLSEISLVAFEPDYYSLYLGWQERMVGVDFSVLVGYTFAPESRVNFSLGLQKTLFPGMNLLLEFANFSYSHRVGSPGFSPGGHAVLNIGARVLPINWLSVDVCGQDILGTDSRFLICANFYFSFRDKKP